jgi:hypothetical protein
MDAKNGLINTDTLTVIPAKAGIHGAASTKYSR